MKKIRLIFWLAIAIIGGIPVIVDAFGAATSLQYLYNLAYLFVGLPVCVAASGLARRLRPDLYGDEDR